ncbi:hypothetical protein ACFSC4_27205 [Deinococcus malanensis]|nr:hypothetical protein [Deinococcus malanensis]
MHKPVARSTSITTPVGLDEYTEVVQRTFAFWADRTSSEEV